VATSPQARGGIEPPTLSSVITTLATLGKAQLPAQLARWLDQLDETGRWTLLKLVTGALRIGVSARLAKTAVAALGDKDADDIELIWPGLTPPYLDLFAWLEGRAGKPATGDPVPFRPVMLSHAIEETDFAALDPAEHCAEWKWDGIRSAGGRRIATERHPHHPPLFAHRRGHFGELSGPCRGAPVRRRDRRRAVDHARAPRSVVQRSAAAA
jgi:ATP-dependent DNA ligase